MLPDLLQTLEQLQSDAYNSAMALKAEGTLTPSMSSQLGQTFMAKARALLRHAVDHGTYLGDATAYCFKC
eukprot:1066841-Alexandrium_andersonii.AAC.1